MRRPCSSIVSPPGAPASAWRTFFSSTGVQGKSARIGRQGCFELFPTSERPDRDIRSGITIWLTSELGRAIVGGYFDHQAFPTEAQLTTQFGTSRTAAREAVKVLTAKGLLVSKAGVGIAINPMERWSLLDPDVLAWLVHIGSAGLVGALIELRAGVDPAAAALAATRRSPRQVQRLGVAVSRLDTCGDGSVLAAATDCHLVLLDASCNTLYARLAEAVAASLALLCLLRGCGAYREAVSPSLYRDLLGAVERREAKAACDVASGIVARSAALAAAASRGSDAGAVETIRE